MYYFYSLVSGCALRRKQKGWQPLGLSAFRSQRSKREIEEHFTYSLMVYYTPEFAAATDDIEEFVDKMIKETNQGYINSKLPITVTKFCSELATISEHCVDPNSVLDAFQSMKGYYLGGSWTSDGDALRNTADAATLLVLNLTNCGGARFATYDIGRTFSWVKKECAIGFFSLGHEVGQDGLVTRNDVFFSSGQF